MASLKADYSGVLHPAVGLRMGGLSIHVKHYVDPSRNVKAAIENRSGEMICNAGNSCRLRRQEVLWGSGRH